MSIWWGVGAGLLASLSWSLSSLCIRAVREVDPVVPILWGQAFGMCLLCGGLLYWPVRDAPLAWGWLLAGGAGSATAYHAMFRAYGGGPLSVTSPIIAGWAMVSALIGMLLFAEPVLPVRILGVVLILAGGAGLVRRAGGPDEEWRIARPAAIGWAALAALGFGVMLASMQPLSRSLGSSATVMSLWAVAWLFMLPGVARCSELRQPPPEPLRRAVLGFGFFEAAGFLVIDLGIQVAPVSVVAPAAGTSCLFTMLWARLWLGEQIGLRRVALGLVVAVGVALLGVAS